MSVTQTRQRPAGVTIVTQTRVRAGKEEEFARWQNSDQRRGRGVSGLHRADGDAAEPAGAGRLGDPAALRQSRGGDRLAAFRAAARSARARAADAGGAGRCASRARRRGGRPAVAGLRGDLHAHQAGPGGRVPRLGAADRRRPGEGAGFSGLPVRAADPGRAGRTGSRSCASTPEANLQAWLDSPERQQLCCKEAQRLHRGISRPHRAHRLRPVVPGRPTERPRRRPGSRT